MFGNSSGNRLSRIRKEKSLAGGLWSVSRELKMMMAAVENDD
jgi:hypothetical protein